MNHKDSLHSEILIVDRICVIRNSHFSAKNISFKNGQIVWNGMYGMNGLGGLLGKNLSYPSEMSKEMSILAFARGSFKIRFSKHQKMDL